jgi:hypothetical protein
MTTQHKPSPEAVDAAMTVGYPKTSFDPPMRKHFEGLMVDSLTAAYAIDFAPQDAPAARELKLSQTHNIERTSPKGPGQKFVGTCTLCGKTGLTFANSREYCENVRGLSEDEALLEVIEAPGKHAPLAREPKDGEWWWVEANAEPFKGYRYVARWVSGSFIRNITPIAPVASPSTVAALIEALEKIADEEDIVNYGHTLPLIARTALACAESDGLIKGEK